MKLSLLGVMGTCGCFIECMDKKQSPIVETIKAKTMAGDEYYGNSGKIMQLVDELWPDQLHSSVCP